MAENNPLFVSPPSVPPQSSFTPSFIKEAQIEFGPMSTGGADSAINAYKTWADVFNLAGEFWSNLKS